MTLLAKYPPNSEKLDRLFIDCEFNSTDGGLISMALVSLDGKEFYEVVDCGEEIDPWVAENVMPILNKDPISFEDFQVKLKDYLSNFNNPFVMADYVDDIKYFMEAMITGPGKWFMIQPLRCEVDDRLSARHSVIKHNALEDARAIRDSYVTPVDKSKPKEV